jgi:hypothetical protein
MKYISLKQIENEKERIVNRLNATNLGFSERISLEGSLLTLNKLIMMAKNKKLQ